MRRRDLIVGGLALPLVAIAQRSARVPLVGLLVAETLSGQAARIEAFRKGLRERGYSVEARNLSLEVRAADGDYGRLPAMAAELVRQQVDLLVTFGGKATSAAKGATTSIPILFVSVTDPISAGIVDSLSKPGGNITGVSNFSELSVKELQLLKEAAPRAVRVGMLFNPANPGTGKTRHLIRDAATSLRLEVQWVPVNSHNELPSVFSRLAKERVEAVRVSGDTLFQTRFAEIASLSAKHRLPSVGRPEFAEAGGLLGYGVDDLSQFRSAAYFVDRILKGARPAELPVERATRFELVVNLKAAKSINLAIPQPLLVRADRVIE